MRSRSDEIREDCNEWSRKNPKVWTLFVRFTFEMIAVGYQHYSVNAIFERIRWETDQTRCDPKKQFKIGNNFRPYYARRFMAMYPEHDGFFRIRELPSKNASPLKRPEFTPQDYC